jgi:universal stress protein A
MTPTKILFCTDFSENSESAGKCALEYSKAFGADLTIIHVIDSWAGFPAYDYGVPQDIRNVVHKLEGGVEAQLEAMVRTFSQAKVKAKACHRIGVPAEEIVQVAKEESADLIVMGTHGWSGFRHMLLGSVAERVLRAATCPVLVVRHSAPDSERE